MTLPLPKTEARKIPLLFPSLYREISKGKDWRLVRREVGHPPEKEGRGGSVNGKPLFVPVVLGWPVNLWSDEIR
ncbi:hypothetical protein NPIL_368191 [Nephila pilipes]|uniref:Uncharacterized protein n=1 Tax=Nephila pilipes TaxID=299642 RepID=A0A8X6USI1_NEPPI|nr:hypothetical protein NPIL_368191 [Nephila pilipes]